MKLNDNRIVSISTAIMAVTACVSTFLAVAIYIWGGKESQGFPGLEASVKSVAGPISVEQGIERPTDFETARKTVDENGDQKLSSIEITGGNASATNTPKLISPKYLPFEKSEIVLEGGSLSTPVDFPSITVSAINWGGSIHVAFSGKNRVARTSDLLLFQSGTMVCSVTFGRVNGGASTVKVATSCE